MGAAADVVLLVIEAAKDDLGGSIEIALEDADIARRAGLEVRERVCKTNAAEAAFELGRWDLVDSMSREMLAREFSGMALAFAHRIAGALACARGELAVAAAHLAAQRDAVGATATEYGAIEAEAELALWDGRPGAALAAAEAGLRIEAEDQLRWVLLAALGARAAADLAELARARGDDAAEAAARERASALREGARERAGDAAHPALAATVEAEHARAADDSDPTLWDAAARLGGAAGAVPGRLRPLAPRRGGAGAARPRPGRAGAARRTRHRGRFRRVRAADRGRSPGPPRAHRATDRRAGASRRPATAGRGGPRAHRPRARGPEAPRARRDQPPVSRRALHQLRTAGVHVSHILGKLSAANRGEAAAIAHRLGLAP